uniref:Uncharacterized protein n=1 Tax=Timspurckia oligopyrenoides TaxID=708627 RepID=A0A7S0ZCW5_9RHOD|mmetsp:Transcript_12835/g.23082  ORF Transcript_12835/g.23082 Transcript_12835/m.23082 type:complete len:130 (+) Transcript_12835:741-1130(+)
MKRRLIAVGNVLLIVSVVGLLCAGFSGKSDGVCALQTTAFGESGVVDYAHSVEAFDDESVSRQEETDPPLLETLPPLETAPPPQEVDQGTISSGGTVGLVVGSLLAVSLIFSVFGLSLRYRRVLENLGM